ELSGRWQADEQREQHERVCGNGGRTRAAPLACHRRGRLHAVVSTGGEYVSSTRAFVAYVERQYDQIDHLFDGCAHERAGQATLCQRAVRDLDVHAVPARQIARDLCQWRVVE